MKSNAIQHQTSDGASSDLAIKVLTLYDKTGFSTCVARPPQRDPVLEDILPIHSWILAQVSPEKFDFVTSRQQQSKSNLRHYAPEMFAVTMYMLSRLFQLPSHYLCSSTTGGPRISTNSTFEEFHCNHSTLGNWPL